MATDFGVDVSCVEDLDPAFELVTGPRAVAQAIARRLMTPRGGLFYAGSYGYDLRQHLNGTIEPGDEFVIAQAIEAQAEQDERVRGASVTVSHEGLTELLRVRIVLVLDEGPFDLVLGVSAVTVEILALTPLS